MYGLQAERVMTVDEVQRLCLDLAPTPIILASELDSLAQMPDRYAILTVDTARGGFPTIIDYSTTHATLPEWEFAARFSTAAQTRCLLPEDTINPFRWLLADTTGEVRPVHVDIDDDGDTEAFTIERDCTPDNDWCRQAFDCRTSTVPPGTILKAS